MKIPKQETIMVSYIFENITEYVATHNILGKYILYKKNNNDYQKIKVSDNPLEFDRIIETERSKNHA